MPLTQNLNALKQAVAAFNDPRRRERYFDLYDPSVTIYGLGPAPLDLAGAKAFYESLWSGFPDGKLTIDSAFGSGEQIAVRFTFSATHRGVFMGVPPTNKAVAFGGITTLRFRKGRCVERWSVADILGLMVQLGAVPAPR